MYNEDESGYFRSFLISIGKVWARKGKNRVARRRGYNRTHIKAMVCVSAARKTITPALLLFSKQACHVFIKATEGDSKKNSPTAVFSRDSKTQDSKQKQKETKRAWFDATTFMEWVREALVAEVHPRVNEFGCVALIVHRSKTHITLSNWSGDCSPAIPLNRCHTATGSNTFKSLEKFFYVLGERATGGLQRQGSQRCLIC